jgi:hypothetical protein
MGSSVMSNRVGVLRHRATSAEQLAPDEKSYFGEGKIRELAGKRQGFNDDEPEETKAMPRSDYGVNIIAKSNVEDLVNNRYTAREQTHSIVLKKWHGYIDSIEGEEFTALLSDGTRQIPDIKITFSKSDVSEGDRELVCEGALLDWVICRSRKSHGQIENIDILVFKRFPMWKKSDLDGSSAKVKEYNEWLFPNNSQPGAE